MIDAELNSLSIDIWIRGGQAGCGCSKIDSHARVLNVMVQNRGQLKSVVKSDMKSIENSVCTLNG